MPCLVTYYENTGAEIDEVHSELPLPYLTFQKGKGTDVDSTFSSTWATVKITKWNNNGKTMLHVCHATIPLYGKASQVCVKKIGVWSV